MSFHSAQHGGLPGASPLATPPPVPTKHQRRLSIKSITASIRRSTSFVSESDQSTTPEWSTEELPRVKARRPSSLFSWRSNRSSIIVVKGDEKEEEEAGRAAREDSPGKENVAPARTKQHRRTRTVSPPPPVPPLVIEIDSLPSLFHASYRPLAPPTDKARARIPNPSSSAPSLPHFRQSTFQPLAFDTTVSKLPPLPKLPPKVGKQLATRGPFPNRPLSTQSFSSPDSLPPIVVPRSRPSGRNSVAVVTASPSSSTLSLRSPAPSRRLEPRSPRVHRRTRSSPTFTAPSSMTASPSSPPLPASIPPPVVSSSTSMHRSPSFTLSLPTVAEIPPPTSSLPRKLKPIVIAPRTPSFPSSPVSEFRQSFPSTAATTATTNSPSFASLELAQEEDESSDKRKEGLRLKPLQLVVAEKEKAQSKQDVGFDWQDLEKRLRNLSEDRLNVLLAELKRTK